MKIRTGFIFVLILSAAAVAQGIESPPVTSFKPDTNLPKVSVPEFVITGRAQTSVERFNKESMEIDSSFFQNKTLSGLNMDIPVNRTLSLQGSGPYPGNLFARVSTGSFATTTYLLSGDGAVGDVRLNGALNGDYTSGFTPQTIGRDFSFQAGIEKRMEFDETTNANNSAEVSYSRGSYFLYGTGIENLLRTTNQFNIGIYSDMNFASFPLTAGLSFDRFAASDLLKDVQSALNIDLNSTFQLVSGSIDAVGGLRFGNHTTTAVDTTLSFSQASQSFYDLTFGARYSNYVEDLYYSIGLNYFQYGDDSSSGIAKLYPDLRGEYKVSNSVSLFARFYGDVENSSVSSFLTESKYLDENFYLRNSQVYADFTVGGNWVVSEEVSVFPQLNIAATKFYPFFETIPTVNSGKDTIQSDTRLTYAGKASIFTASVTARYKKDKFSGEVAFNSRTGSVDSLTSIPYLAPFDIDVKSGYQITPQFNFSASISILSDRYSDISLKNKLNSVWLLNFHLSYELQVGTLPVEIYADGKNILDQKYYIWEGYQEFPLGLYVGVDSKIL